DPHAAPVGEITGRAGINIVASGFVEELGQPQDNAHQVGNAALLVSLLHGRSNLVVGLRHDVFYADHGWVGTQCAKGINSGHALGSNSRHRHPQPALPIALLSYTCQIVPDLRKPPPGSREPRPTGDNTRNKFVISKV